MDTSKNNNKSNFRALIIIISMFFIWRTPTFADFARYAELQKGTRVFFDQIDQEKLLIIDQNGNYHPTHSECAVEKLSGMKLAFPFFVDLGKICMLNEINKTIDLLHLESAPNNAFSIMYWGQNEDWIYFLINGKPWETDGYLKVQAINRKTGKIFLRDLILQVPGYSGGMWMDGNNFFITVWDGSNEVFTLDNKLVWQALLNSATIPFEQVAKKVTGPFKGLSLTMFAGSDNFLFYNSGRQSYLIHKDTGIQSKILVPKECSVLGPVKHEWFLICNETELKKGIF